MIVQLALVSQSKQIPHSEVSLVSAALQKQVTRDFGPIWNVQATVDSFEKLNQVPVGYWPMVVRDDVRAKQGAEGIHLDKNGQPYALIQADEGWGLTASHETLEILGDPFGDRLVAGAAPKEMKGQKRVEYLVEVCDPSEAEEFGYTVNDILLSDFYTPAYFDPVAASSVRYSFTGAITKPRQVLRGGYISFHNPVDDHWYQVTWFSGNKPKLRDLGIFEASNKSTREMIDIKTKTPRMEKKARKPEPVVAASMGTVRAAPAKAHALQQEIEALLGKSISID